MFEKRLVWFSILLSVLALAIIARLVQIQVYESAHYARLADEILTRPADYLAAPRGTVFDHNGIPLLSDEPSLDVCIHYAVITDRTEVHEDYLRSLARALRRSGEFPLTMPVPEVVAQLEGELDALWPRLAALLGEPVAELRARAVSEAARIDRIRDAVRRQSPHVLKIAEEDQRLPVAEGLDDAIALPVRLELERRPWLRVQPGSHRVAHDGNNLVHLLGRLGAASAERIASDPLRDDELRRLRPVDNCGISGIERLAEPVLRGARGRIVESYDRTVLEHIEPQPGRDVYLTIDFPLQTKVMSLLAAATQECVHPAGAAAVVIDVDTREIRALASFPTYDYATFNEQYPTLRDDTKNLPLTFRAVQAEYAPGSICKGITLVAGLGEGVITPETRFHCTGALLPDHPNQFRCWIFKQNPGLTHDMFDDPQGQNGVRAVRNSCNIYFFRVGGLLGPERLCEWFRKFGLGRPVGTGLIEEATGIVPDEAWMRAVAHRDHRPADAWNFAIGQGEVTVTPLQAANVVTTIATGEWQPVRLAYDAENQLLGAPYAPPTRFDDANIRVLREGMWMVVNDHRPGNRPTGYRAALDRDDYEMCGKTGTAQARPRVINRRYICEWPDGTRADVIARSEAEALEKFPAEKPKVVGYRYNELYPRLLAGESLPSHAWFVGWTQLKSTPRGARPRGHVYAIAVLIEFGDSGGRVAAPVAKAIAEYLLERDDHAPPPDRLSPPPEPQEWGCAAPFRTDARTGLAEDTAHG